MIDINCLHDLDQYSNFETYRFGEKDIILYDDHRCILTALYEARRLGMLKHGANIVSFDRHDDARPIDSAVDTINEYVKVGIENVNQRDFKNFVEFDIREIDDDWVCVGMELGLINSIVNVGNTDCCNIVSWKDHEYVDMLGNKHKGQVIDHIANEFQRVGGALGDMARYDDFRVVHETLGYNIAGERSGFSDSISDFVLDIDLDCFTTDCQGSVFAWPEVIFNRIYGFDNNAAGYFMEELIRRAKFITICREPSYCGGIGESIKILGYLDKYFFHGSLGTSVIR